MVRPMLKVCGLHSEKDVFVASRSKADYAGFVMAESKRKVTPHEAASWLERHPLPDKKVAALFVNATLREVKEAVDIFSPEIVQLHGTESPEEASRLREATGKEIWKAISHEQQALNKMESYAGIVDGFVIDAKVKGAWGGTGKQFDWSHVPGYVSFGKEHGIPVLIAGGITPENVEDLLPYHPWGIDLSSGVEAKGKKDETLLCLLESRLNRYE